LIQGTKIGLLLEFNNLFNGRAKLLFEVRSYWLNLEPQTLNKFSLLIFYVSINNYIYHGK